MLPPCPPPETHLMFYNGKNTIDINIHVQIAFLTYF